LRGPKLATIKEVQRLEEEFNLIFIIITILSPLAIFILGMV
jgi:hypothetical protein